MVAVIEQAKTTELWQELKQQPDLQWAIAAKAADEIYLPTSAVSRLTGLSLRQLRYLAQTETVVPSVRTRSGPGNELLYAPSDLFELTIIQKVRAICGVEVRLERVNNILAVVRSHNSSLRQYLVLDDETCRLQTDGIEPALELSGAALILDLQAITAGVRGLLASAYDFAPAQIFAA